jgi:hypothetical protein
MDLLALEALMAVALTKPGRAFMSTMASLNKGPKYGTFGFLDT